MTATSKSAFHWCDVCQDMKPVSKHWITLWIDGAGNLVISRYPVFGESFEAGLMGVKYVCGDSDATLLASRFLSLGGLAPNQAPACDPVNTHKERL